MENTIKSVSLGYGCKRCSKRYQYSTEEWIKEAKNVHGDKYQYHLTQYVDSDTKVEIVCPKHGMFTQIPYYHYRGKVVLIVLIKNFTRQKALLCYIPKLPHNGIMS